MTTSGVAMFEIVMMALGCEQKLSILEICDLKIGVVMAAIRAVNISL